MTEFTILKSLGISNIHNISHYKLTTENGMDVLKIFMKHETKDLSQSAQSCHTFSFELNKVVAADSTSQEIAKRYAGSDPVLMAAINELNTLSKSSHR